MCMGNNSCVADVALRLMALRLGVYTVYILDILAVIIYLLKKYGQVEMKWQKWRGGGELPTSLSDEVLLATAKERSNPKQLR